VTNVTIPCTKKDAIDDGLGLKSGLILGPLIAIEIPFNREATSLSRPYQLTGSTPQEVGLPRRCTSPEISIDIPSFFERQYFFKVIWMKRN
jgi:hypothetical protein